MSDTRGNGDSGCLVMIGIFIAILLFMWYGDYKKNTPPPPTTTTQQEEKSPS